MPSQRGCFCVSPSDETVAIIVCNYHTNERLFVLTLRNEYKNVRMSSSVRNVDAVAEFPDVKAVNRQTNSKWRRDDCACGAC